MARRGPSIEQLKRLRDLRMQAGLSLETVAERTGLPVAHVEALENGEVEELPAGPYVGAYYRLVRGVVGAKDEDEAPLLPEPGPEPRLPLWAVRTIAIATVLCVTGLFGWWISTLDLGDLAGAASVAGGMVAGGSSADELDQVVVLTARREARFRVLVDGAPELDGRLPPRASRTFRARDRIVVEVQGAEDARIEYNGQPIVPQGRQGVPRRLVFVDDLP